jgi:hypothetical protein
MEERLRLYVLGDDEVREYSLKNWDSSSPTLKMEKRFPLPNNNGHDLSRINKNTLLITTEKHTYTFDLTDYSFKIFDPLESSREVKSVYYNDETGELIYTAAEESWWTHNIYLKNPDKKITIPDLNMYKIRVVK